MTHQPNRFGAIDAAARYVFAEQEGGCTMWLPIRRVDSERIRSILDRASEWYGAPIEESHVGRVEIKLDGQAIHDAIHQRPKPEATDG